MFENTVVIIYLLAWIMKLEIEFQVDNFNMYEHFSISSQFPFMIERSDLMQTKYYRLFVSYRTRFSQVNSHIIQLGQKGPRQSYVIIFTMVTYFLRWTLLKFFSSFPDEQSQQKVRQLDRITAQWLIHQMKLRARYCGNFELIFLWEF